MRPRGLLSAIALTAGCALSVVAASPPPASADPSMVTLAQLPRPPHPLDFEAAKRAMRDRVYDAPHRRELYCGCAYDESKRIDFTSCESAHPYVPVETHHARAERMEWEHVVPASWTGRTMPCWSDPLGNGRHRDFCRETSADFRFAEGDLHDLYPSVGQLNALRDDDAYGEIEGETHVAGCDFEIDTANHVVEPRDAIRGDVARVTFYMSATYQVPLRRALYDTLVRWHRRDPPDAFERFRNERIESIQGNRNPFVDGRVALH